MSCGSTSRPYGRSAVTVDSDVVVSGSSVSLSFYFGCSFESSSGFVLQPAGKRPLDASEGTIALSVCDGVVAGLGRHCESEVWRAYD
jgi:hypothetical protein